MFCQKTDILAVLKYSFEHTIGSFFEDQSVVALMISNTAADEEQAIFRVLRCHQTLFGGVVCQHYVLQHILRVITQCPHTHAHIVLLPARKKMIEKTPSVNKKSDPILQKDKHRLKKKSIFMFL